MDEHERHFTQHMYDYFMAQAVRLAWIANDYRKYGPAKTARSFEDAAAQMAERAMKAKEM